MKVSNRPRAHMLLKAQTNSEWDTCDFAIVHLCEEWKKQQAKRLMTVKPFAGDSDFQSLNYCDNAIEFYRTAPNDRPDIEALLEGKEWVFVELDKDEEQTFAVPENRFNGCELIVYKTGYAMYRTYGKHTGEEFWTMGFSLEQIIG